MSGVGSYLETGVKQSVLNWEMFSVSTEDREGCQRLNGSRHRHVQKEILHWERAANLLNLILVFVPLHEEHVRHVLLLSTLDHIGQLRSIFSRHQDSVSDQGHTLIGYLETCWVVIKSSETELVGIDLT